MNKMKIRYYEDTDSAYIDLSDRKSKETRIISDGSSDLTTSDVNIDLDENGTLVGIDIHQNAKSIIDLKSINFENLANIA